MIMMKKKEKMNMMKKKKMMKKKMMKMKMKMKTDSQVLWHDSACYYCYYCCDSHYWPTDEILAAARRYRCFRKLLESHGCRGGTGHSLHHLCSRIRAGAERIGHKAPTVEHSPNGSRTL